MKARYISVLNSKGNIFFKRLRIATGWLTLREILRICPSNLSLLSIVTPRSSISSWLGITVPSQVNTGFLWTLPKVTAWYFEWFLSFDWIHRLNFFQRSLIQAFSLLRRGSRSPWFKHQSQSSCENLWDLQFVECRSGYRWTCFLQIHLAGLWLV